MKDITNVLKERVLLLDGSMGVMLQRKGLTESVVRGRRFMTHPRPLLSDLDILCLSRPDIVAEVHDAYLEAGADIIETNTFNSNALSQREYGTAHLVGELNRAGARIARECVCRMMEKDPSRQRYVAGSMGPTGMSASLPVDVSDPVARGVDFDTLKDAYAGQAAALIEGGVDLLLIETAFDLLNAKAALVGAREAMERSGREVPVMVSITVSETSGRILSGHTPEAVVTALAPFAPAALGFNCSAGPADLIPVVRRLAKVSPFPVIFYPNAGLPDQAGAYSVSPEEFAADMAPLLRDGVLNIVGGCCGTSPQHIRALAGYVSGEDTCVHAVADGDTAGWLAGLEDFYDRRGFINVGERCNVAGSRKFLKLISEGDLEGALAVAVKQVADGAMMLDINMDDPMLDAPVEMSRFLRMLGSDPSTSSLPWMIDSSDFSVIESALREIAGKCVVNSISLKHGEEEFMRQASLIRSYGAAVVVMLFDERGQADTFERKIGIAERSVRLLTGKCGFSPRDIVIDPNVLTVATGIADHDRYALDFIRAVSWIKENLPGVKTSGGVSNLSFAFRGNNYIRQAMHAVFLYHAIRAGLDMAIVDPGAKVTYAEIDPSLRERIEDVILCRRADACERLIEAAGAYAGRKISEVEAEAAVSEDVCRRLAHALVQGDGSRLAEDLPEAVAMLGDANAVVEGPLMDGMEEVGRRFETGRMFLPQVVKSARTMHMAVDILRPMLEAGKKSASRRGTFLLATVRGDVHDIGKNIVAVVLECNNFEVVDLGVQVEARTIVDAALRLKPDFIGLSGLISPSLAEMAATVAALREAGVSVPVFVGGAATTELHAALKIAPAYGEGLVVKMSDASQNPVVASRLLLDYEGEARKIRDRQQRLVDEYNAAASASVDESACGSLVPETDWSGERFDAPSFTGVRTLTPVGIADVRPYINYTYFYKCWQVNPESDEASALRSDAESILDELQSVGAVMWTQVAFYGAHSEGDTIVVDVDGGSVSIPTPRQAPSAGRDRCLALSDFIAPEGYGDHIGCFAVTVGDTIRRLVDSAAEGKDDYRRLLLQSVADRLAEATSEWLHREVRTRLWGYAADEKYDPVAIRRGEYRGIRPAVGYPSLPDQLLMHRLLGLLHPSEIGLAATANGALTPSSSVAGFYLASPRARYFTL